MPALTETAPPNWLAPPRPCTAQGRERRLGVELEFAGLSAGEAAQIVARELGGVLRPVSDQQVRVEESEIGTVVVELDLKYAHSGDPEDPLRKRLSQLGATVLPMEIVFPPVALSKAGRVDAVVARLREGGALGTFHNPFFAFGAQLNPELPELSADYILRGLQAFLLLRDWLRAEVGVDPSRKLWFFAAPFPEAYVDQVLAPGYAPDLATLTDDYLAANPTRNREVDLLPLLAHLDEARVRAILPEETIKPRPTWHYRLPNAMLDEPAWCIAAEWARWVMVERLAERTDLIVEHAARRAARRARILPLAPVDRGDDLVEALR